MKRPTISCPSLILSVTAAFAGWSSAALYTDGHGDFGLAYENGNLHFHFHAGGATVDGYETDGEFELADVITVVSTDALMVLPVDMPALGAGSGQSVWVLPQSQNVMLPFLGLATEELPAGQWTDITFTLGTVNSPSGAGHFALWQYDVFGDTIIRMSTADPGVDEVTLGADSHAHHNWGFTEAGIWTIELTASGTHAMDGFKQTTEIITFQVVPEPSAVLVSCASAVLLAFRRKRR